MNTIIVVAIIVNLVNIYQCVESPPSLIKQPPNEQLYEVALSSNEEDRPFMLECDASGDPEPTYWWTKDGFEFNYLFYDTRISQKPRSGTLVFNIPDSIDEGRYQCFAENKHGVSISDSVYLRKSHLDSLAEAKEEVKMVYVNEGQPLTLNCNPPTGYPKPSIFWMILSNSGFNIINSSRLTVDPMGRLHFSNVTREDVFDNAIYVCAFNSSLGNQYKLGGRTIIKITAHNQTDHPFLHQYTSPSSISALRDQKLELHCIYGGTPLPDIKWTKDKSILFNSLGNFGKTLVINKVDFKDEGVYECTANNSIGQQKLHRMEVRVNSAPYWTTYPNDTIAAEGEPVSLRCIASGRPTPKLQWFVNGVPIERAPHNSRRIVVGPFVVIFGVNNKVDTSVYQCNASNVYGYVFRNFYLNVLSRFPTIIEKPEEKSEVVVDSNTTLRCRVFGAPKPVVKWEKDGLAIELGGFNSTNDGRYELMKSGDLRIEGVNQNDTGTYMCSATNLYGNTNATALLDVKQNMIQQH